MNQEGIKDKVAAYRAWVRAGAPDPLSRIDDCMLLKRVPDLIHGATPFAQVFGMTTVMEQAFCHWYGAHAYKGWGEWIELGTFLGSLTYPSVRGLRANNYPQVRKRKIRVYDLFFWDSTMAETARYSCLIDLPKEGDWYIDFYRKFIAPIIDRVEVNQADLTQFKYSGGEIEFLLVDAMKYPALVRNIMQSFFPYLKSGSILFHQDYLHFYESWITLAMYQMRDQCKCIKVLPDSEGVIFEMTGTPVDRSLTFPLDSKEIDSAWIEDAFNWSRSIIPEDQHSKVDATQCMMYFHAGKSEASKDLYQRARSRYPHSEALDDLLKYLKSAQDCDLEADS